MSDSLDRLFAAVNNLKKADPARSRTARLMRSGRSKIAKKLGEEAVEVVIDAMQGLASYANVHSDQFPGGEIRGQIVPLSALPGVQPPPTTAVCPGSRR